MTRTAVAVLGVGQCVNWGVLYYSFAVLVQPLERELGVQTWVVTGAFSCALLVSAVFAPAVGRWSDRERGAAVMQAGGAGAAALLAAWTLLPGVLALYVVWAGLGLCMAATLYEPAFAIIGRAHDDAGESLRALAMVTLFGGLASTLFLPGTAFLLATAGWRVTVLVLAALLGASTFVTRMVVFDEPHTARKRRASDEPTDDKRGHGSTGPQFMFVATVFALASLASAAFTANLVPALGERGISPGSAAMLGGLIGVMQLPGRAFLLSGAFGGSPSHLLAVSLALQAAGYAGLALAPSVPAAAGATATFALGAGLMTLVRPYLVQTIFPARHAGFLNGRIARRQQLGRAAGPLAVAWMAGAVGYGWVLAGLGALFATIAIASSRMLVSRSRS